MSIILLIFETNALKYPSLSKLKSSVPNNNALPSGIASLRSVLLLRFRGAAAAVSGTAPITTAVKLDPVSRAGDAIALASAIARGAGNR